MGAIDSFFQSIVAPGFVAAVVAYILNTRDERNRTLRDYKTKFSEDTREDIRLAVTAGVAYFSCKDGDKLGELEAQVLLYESDVRSGLAAIRGECGDIKRISALENLEADFLDTLTGASFGNASPSPDLNHARKLVGRGSILRSELAELRRHQLSKARFVFPVARGVAFSTLLLALVGVTFGSGVYLGAVILSR